MAPTCGQVANEEHKCIAVCTYTAPLTQPVSLELETHVR